MTLAVAPGAYRCGTVRIDRGGLAPPDAAREAALRPRLRWMANRCSSVHTGASPAFMTGDPPPSPHFCQTIQDAQAITLKTAFRDAFAAGLKAALLFIDARNVGQRNRLD